MPSKSATDQMDQARVDAVVGISDAIISAIAKELKTHGPDPRNSDIIAAAMALAIVQLNSVDPSISYYIATIMTHESRRQG